MGALGLLSFLWLYISLICYGISLYRKLKDDRDRTTALGISGAFLSLMIAALAGPLFTAPMVTVWVGFLMGVLLVLDKNTGQTEA
jgi:cell division protein FtsW (lipid II flippase)